MKMKYSGDYLKTKLFEFGEIIKIIRVFTCVDSVSNFFFFF